MKKIIFKILAIGVFAVALTGLHQLFTVQDAFAVEPQCPGGSSPNPNVVWCDDFEDGTWLDTWNSGGGAGPAIDGKNAVVCGNQGATDNCRATDFDETLSFDGSGWSGYYGESKTPPPFGTEYYWRFYFRVSNPFRFGSTGSKVFKHRNVNTGNCIIVTNCINMTFVITDNHKLIMDNANGANAVPPGTNYGAISQNQGNSITLTGGHWYLVEFHVKMNTPGVFNGIYEQWLDDCGVNATGCPTKANQTLRSKWTNVDWRYSNITSNNIQLGGYWQGYYHNPDGSGGVCGRGTSCAPYPGQHQDWDNFVISRARIGPAGNTQVNPDAPTAPSGLIVR